MINSANAHEFISARTADGETNELILSSARFVESGEFRETVINLATTYIASSARNQIVVAMVVNGLKVEQNELILTAPRIIIADWMRLVRIGVFQLSLSLQTSTSILHSICDDVEHVFTLA